MIDTISIIFMTLVINYAIHSTVLLSGAYLVTRYGFSKNPRITELIWRCALFGALLTAPIQAYTHSAHYGSIATNTHMTQTPIASTNRRFSNDVSKTVSKPHITNSNLGLTPNNLGSDSPPSSVPYEALAARSEAMEEVYLRPNVTYISAIALSITPYVMLAWLIYALYLTYKLRLKIAITNSLAAHYEQCDPGYFSDFIVRSYNLAPSTFNIKINSDWKSPIVMPDSSICMPKWAFLKLNQKQLEAMLAHEIAHVLRRDPVWGIAIEFMKHLFFFQPLNRIASTALATQAEYICDQSSSDISGHRKELAEALYACAIIQKNHALPTLAIAMSNPASPLFVRIQTLLSENIMKANHYRVKSRLQLGFFLLLASCSIISTSFAIPKINSLSKKNPTSPVVNTVYPIANDNTIQEIKIPSSTGSSPTTSNLAPIAVDTEVKSNSNTASQINQDNISFKSPETKATLVSTQESSGQESNSLSEIKNDINAKDFRHAVDLLTPLAEAGNAEAQYLLGELSWYGEGVTANLSVAEKWFRLAAKNGNERAKQFSEMIDKRSLKASEIAFYMNETSGKDFDYLENKCPAPAFKNQSYDFNSHQMKAWHKCFRDLSSALTIARQKNQLIVPRDLLPILTESEIHKIEENSNTTLDQLIASIDNTRNKVDRTYAIWASENVELQKLMNPTVFNRNFRENRREREVPLTPLKNENASISNK
jgi:beta-lactamase regulating signal transducer with metallopeptidase domain